MTVLIVDDSAVTRVVIRAVLEGEPGLFVCGEAVNGVDGIRKAQEFLPDLVVLDLAMPKLNGVETAAALKRVLPKVRIILFTMFDEAAHALAPAVGADAVLSKPDGLRNLIARIRSFVDSENPISA